MNFKFLIIALLLIVPQLAQADFIFAPGVTVTSAYKSEETDSADQEKLNMQPGFGFELNFEVIFLKILTLNIGGLYYGAKGEAQYDFQSTTANELDTTTRVFAGIIGPRLRLINFTHFKMFFGGGYLVGSQALTYDEDDFRSTTGNLTNFEENESTSFNGHYFEGGAEYIISKESALRVAARQLSYKTKKLKTLGDDIISIDHAQFVIQYMHYVNWNFFWK